jgi:hypothetical protein
MPVIPRERNHPSPSSSPNWKAWQARIRKPGKYTFAEFRGHRRRSRRGGAAAGAAAGPKQITAPPPAAAPAASPWHESHRQQANYGDGDGADGESPVKQITSESQNAPARPAAGRRGGARHCDLAAGLLPPPGHARGRPGLGCRSVPAACVDLCRPPAHSRGRTCNLNCVLSELELRTQSEGRVEAWFRLRLPVANGRRGIETISSWRGRHRSPWQCHVHCVVTVWVSARAALAHCQEASVTVTSDGPCVLGTVGRYS